MGTSGDRIRARDAARRRERFTSIGVVGMWEECVNGGTIRDAPIVEDAVRTE